MDKIHIKYKRKIGLYLFSLKSMIDNKKLTYLLKNYKKTVLDLMTIIDTKDLYKFYFIDNLYPQNYCMNKNNLLAFKYLKPKIYHGSYNIYFDMLSQCIYTKNLSLMIKILIIYKSKFKHENNIKYLFREASIAGFEFWIFLYKIFGYNIKNYINADILFYCVKNNHLEILIWIYKNIDKTYNINKYKIINMISKLFDQKDKYDYYIMKYLNIFNCYFMRTFEYPSTYIFHNSEL